MKRNSAVALTVLVVPVVLALAEVAMGQVEYKIPAPREYKTLAGRGRGWSDGTLGGGYVKPDPAFKPTFLPDGQVNIQGSWRQRTNGNDIKSSIEALDENDVSNEGAKVFRAPAEGKVIGRIVDPPGGKAPYKAWARILRNEFDAGYIDSQSACVPNAPPRLMTYQGHLTIQMPGKVLNVTDAYVYRHIYLDGRPHPAQSAKSYIGSSRGYWKGNTLYTDVRNMNDKTWLSLRGDFHSDQLRVREQITPVAKNMLQYEVAIEDPVVFERPWAMAWPLVARADDPDESDMLELYCGEGNLSTQAQVEGGRKIYRGLSEVLKTKPEI